MNIKVLEETMKTIMKERFLVALKKELTDIQKREVILSIDKRYDELHEEWRKLHKEELLRGSLEKE